MPQTEYKLATIAYFGTAKKQLRPRGKFWIFGVTFSEAAVASTRPI
jgi:hypothetical protein